MDEFSLIKRFFYPLGDVSSPSQRSSRLLLGNGDDCAVFSVEKPMAISTDTSVEGVHFLSEMKPEDIGWRALAVALSDLAAQGAIPRFFLLSLSLPSRYADSSWLEAFAKGMAQLAEKQGVSLIGGDTTRSDQLHIGIHVMGELPVGSLGVTRAGAKVGDDIWVSGSLGKANVSLENPNYLRPEPRTRLGLELHNIATAMIDLSDGLSGDLVHIVKASQVGAEVWLDHLPLAEGVSWEQGLSQGDDYELCFTSPPGKRDQIEAIQQLSGIPLSRVGRIHHASEELVYLSSINGKAVKVSSSGYLHFQKS